MIILWILLVKPFFIFWLSVLNIFLLNICFLRNLFILVILIFIKPSSATTSSYYIKIIFWKIYQLWNAFYLLSSLKINFWFYLLTAFLNKFLCCILRLFSLSRLLNSCDLLYHWFLLIYKLILLKIYKFTFKLLIFIIDKNFSGSIISLEALKLMVNSYSIHSIIWKQFSLLAIITLLFVLWWTLRSITSIL